MLRVIKQCFAPGNKLVKIRTARDHQIPSMVFAVTRTILLSRLSLVLRGERTG